MEQKKKRGENLDRFTIEFSRQAANDLDNLCNELNLTRVGVIRKAVSILKFIKKQRDEGFELRFISEEKNLQREVVFM